MCLVSGCVAVGDDPVTATIDIKTQGVQYTAATRGSQLEKDGLPMDTGPDLCAAADQLPGTDVCSLICDPPAMADFLIAEGMHTGACYQLRCTLPGVDSGVSVGVCLAPAAP